MSIGIKETGFKTLKQQVADKLRKRTQTAFADREPSIAHDAAASAGDTGVDDPTLMQARAIDDPHFETHGMPLLRAEDYRASWFEFVHPWLFYLPIFFWVLVLIIRHRAATLMTGANPGLPMSGLIGESKREVLDAVRGDARHFISPYRVIRREADADATLEAAKTEMIEAQLSFPVVAKPDMGMRGAGVQLIKTMDALDRYIKDFPVGADIMLQALIEADGEAGIFYVREPGQAQGEILSVTLKYFPKLIGDGRSTVRALLMAHPRGSQIPHLYEERLAGQMDHVPGVGDVIDLVFAGNHSQGTLFRNGNDLITDAMRARFDELTASIDEFYIGRYDIRFRDFEQVRQGKGFRIIEINGAGGEMTHIWDARTTLIEAYRTVGGHFSRLYRLGKINKRRGFPPATLNELRKAWWSERTLTQDYPETH